MAMELLLNNLKELLVYHSHLITDTRSEIESLEKDLRLCNAFLKDSLQKPVKDERTKELVRCIRDVVYEVEDVVDAFVTRALEKKSKAGSFLSFLKFWEPSIDLHSIGKKVEEVKLKVEQAKVDFATLNVDDEDSSHKPEVRPPRQKDVVGFEDVTKELISRLTKQTNYFDVVSLIGMFGLGKTTLAWKIFNDPAILYEFPFRIWLPISQEFSLKDTFLAILKEFTTITNDIRQQHEHQLAKMVSAKLETSSFLIVMDDVWSTADWGRLRDALPTNKNGKVLITSRIEKVGIHASCPRPPHKLRFFDQDESWELLRLEAIRTSDCPPELEEVGKFIASDCGGLPLAIVVIGGILATKFSSLNINATRSEWESVSTQVGTHLTKNDPAERLKKFISLSYDKLPYHLRTCFLYLGMFREDYEIPASKLIKMWIAEGFIQQNVDPNNLEQIAQKYLDDLINRNLVRIEKFKPDSKVKTCRIHDTLRDFCRAEAANENENFFQEIKYNNGVFVPPISALNRYVRGRSENVVGFDEDIYIIMDRLREGSSKLQALPILGTGGIGKTTVARMIYNHRFVLEYFQIRVWVTVSQEYSVKSIFSKFLASMKVKGIVAESEEEKIREYLKGGRYLIVLDDMWSKKAWDDVKMLFPDNHNGSRIVLTTRLPDVAAYAHPSGPIHEMCFLDEEQSWHLLQERVFGHASCPLELEEVGRKIVTSCGGLPLSIVVVAGLLASFDFDWLNKSCWEQIAENDGKLETLLCLSYAHLPHHLRACFLYLGAFPEDYEISVSELIKLWAAEHFVKPLTNQNLEEMAEEFLADLVDRSLVLVTNRKYYGRFRSCRFKSCSLHDMVRDFCIRQARQEKLLIPVMDYLPSPILRKHFLPRVLKNHRRLSLTSHDLNVKDSTDGSHIRTIICIKQKGYKSVGSVEKFSSLRVLHVLGGDNDWDWEPGQVFNLIHLTYLASHIPTSIVPPTISKLQNLQTLIIYRFDVCLPVEIWRLRQLRHLIAFSFHPLPSPEGQVLPLEDLQTLSMAKNFVCSVRTLEMIPNVKKLGICYLEENSYEGYHLHNLQHLSRLEKLKLKMRSHTPFGARLNYGFPSSLRRLTLSGLRIPWRDMTVVGSLRLLQVLKLRNYACDGDLWETNEGMYRSLQVLLIDGSNLREWRTESSHFRRLRHLSIHRCPFLYEIPYGIGGIPTSEVIEVDDQNSALLESVKRIKLEQEEYGNEDFRVHVKRY